MKNNNKTSSYSVKQKLILKTEPSKNYELNSKKSLKYHLLFPKNDFLFKKDNVFRQEKMRFKENIFQSFKNTPKREIKKENFKMKKNMNKLIHSISILNNANLDEGIVLNKYFTYLKNYELEYNKKLELELENLLKPIRKKEKEILIMKKNIKFYKNISNQMLLKYMVENQDKLYKYMKEISTYQNKDDEINYQCFRTRNIAYFPEKNSSKTNSYFNNGNKIFNTCSNNLNNKKINLRKQIFENRDKKFAPKLKLNDEENNIFITSYSRNKNKTNSNLRVLTAISSPKKSFCTNGKYFTPQTIKRKNKLYITNNEKSTGKTDYSSIKSNKIKDFAFNNIFNRIKLKD